MSADGALAAVSLSGDVTATLCGVSPVDEHVIVAEFVIVSGSSPDVTVTVCGVAQFVVENVSVEGDGLMYVLPAVRATSTVTVELGADDRFAVNVPLVPSGTVIVVVERTMLS